MNRLSILFFVFIIPSLVTALGPVVIGTSAVAQADSETTTLDYILEAEQIAFYTNIQRRAHGLAPLKISRELTEAALLFAEDAVVNMESNYCGHSSSDGRDVGDRLRDNGMIGMAMWGENVVCGYMTPQAAVDAWMESDGHRENILTPEFTEIGIGHFVDDISGYIVQNFALDGNQSFVIINNESPSTPSPNVELYIYDHSVRSGMAGLGPAVEMMISNSPNFADAAWRPFANEVSWTLEGGEGQRRVYVVTRDADGRRGVRFDDIYLGTSPSTELTLDSYPSIKTQISGEMITNQLPHTQNADKIQLSMEWEFCESDSDVQTYLGTVETVADANAHGGSAMKIAASDQQAIVSMWTQEYIPDEAMVGYVRLKVDDNQTATEVLTVDVLGDDTVYTSHSILASDFDAPGVYQDFPVRFTVRTDFKPALLTINLSQQNSAVVYFDGLSFYTDSMPLASDFSWTSMRPAYRDRGLRVRTVAQDGTFSQPHHIYPLVSTTGATAVLPPTDNSGANDPVANPAAPVTPDNGHGDTQAGQDHISLQTVPGGQVSITHRLGISCSNCPQPAWNVTSDAHWLSGSSVDGTVEINVNAANLPIGNHEANLMVQPDDGAAATATEIVVYVTVMEVPVQPEQTVARIGTNTIFLPVTLK